MTDHIYDIPPSLFCVPAVICALTGEPLVAVVNPALNRHGRRRDTLTGTVAGVSLPVLRDVLDELGYRLREYRHDDLRARVSTWAKRSLRWPGRNVLISTSGHALVVRDGKVYDNHEPIGVPPERHSWRNVTVTYAALVERKR